MKNTIPTPHTQRFCSIWSVVWPRYGYFCKALRVILRCSQGCEYLSDLILSPGFNYHPNNHQSSLSKLNISDIPCTFPKPYRTPIHGYPKPSQTYHKSHSFAPPHMSLNLLILQQPSPQLLTSSNIPNQKHYLQH